MPFNGGIGFHDANWRSKFGGAIYQTSGSHGCVNLPPAKAAALYDLVYTGIPVICYN
ncbi:MAG: L,D-transpeptidase [Clostridium sp.]